MAIGERIHFFRTLRGMTQKYLGMALGFPEKSADVRLAQYENGSRDAQGRPNCRAGTDIGCLSPCFGCARYRLLCGPHAHTLYP